MSRYYNGTMYVGYSLTEPLQQRPVYDVTAKFARDMINTLNYRALHSHKENARKLWEHAARYEAILNRHTSYEPSPYEGPRYSYR